ncbi:cyclic nucleotide-binding domain-containing protein [Pseudooceanicola algae]|uniref:hypothetical protein n=1 Tax=Pseudooceanicola algae TaxID=1537215 RepID=UPI000E6C1B36|nr:hypothetical protein [Pseudooceanicola algae]
MLTPDTRDAVLSVGETVQVTAGNIVVREGEETTDLYIIEAGDVACMRAGAEEDDDDWPVLARVWHRAAALRRASHSFLRRPCRHRTMIAALCAGSHCAVSARPASLAP